MTTTIPICLSDGLCIFLKAPKDDAQLLKPVRCTLYNKDLTLPDWASLATCKGKKVEGGK